MFSIRIFVLLVALWPGLSLCAEDEDEAPVPAAVEEGTPDDADSGAPADGVVSGPIYIPLKPPLVVNYGGPGRLKYIKADLSVRVASGTAADSIRHHMPYIRNNLIMLFSAQSDETIASQSGKEALRRESLREIQNIVKTEDKVDGVTDLYFNSFILQK